MAMTRLNDDCARDAGIEEGDAQRVISFSATIIKWLIALDRCFSDDPLKTLHIIHININVNVKRGTVRS